jgi:hypothetical protein
MTEDWKSRTPVQPWVMVLVYAVRARGICYSGSTKRETAKDGALTPKLGESTLYDVAAEGKVVPMLRVTDTQLAQPATLPLKSMREETSFGGMRQVRTSSIVSRLKLNSTGRARTAATHRFHFLFLPLQRATKCDCRTSELWRLPFEPCFLYWLTTLSVVSAKRLGRSSELLRKKQSNFSNPTNFTPTQAANHATTMCLPTYKNDAYNS